MTDFPRSLIEFQRRFADEGACAGYLAQARWPDGFCCPACGHGKGWALGVYHGLREKHLQSYLDEFTFRFNRRRSRHAAFRSLLAITVVRKPITYNILIAPETTA